MFCSIREAKEKRRPQMSGIYLNPTAKVVSQRWMDGQTGEFNTRYAVALQGTDEVVREPMTKWTIALNESKRDGDKIIKRQHHIVTLSFWDFANDYMREAAKRHVKDLSLLSSMFGSTAYWIDADSVADRVRDGINAHFPLKRIALDGLSPAKRKLAELEQMRLSAEHAGIVGSVMAKVDAIRKVVATDYRKTPEYKALKACLDVLARPVDEIRQEEAQARDRARKAEDARKQQQFEDARRYARQSWSGGGLGHRGGSLGADEVRSLFRKAAMACHPDQGGSDAAMAALNAMKDALLAR